jgi:hypothetical protein
MVFKIVETPHRRDSTAIVLINLTPLAPHFFICVYWHKMNVSGRGMKMSHFLLLTPTASVSFAKIYNVIKVTRFFFALKFTIFFSWAREWSRQVESLSLSIELMRHNFTFLFIFHFFNDVKKKIKERKHNFICYGQILSSHMLFLSISLV